MRKIALLTAIVAAAILPAASPPGVDREQRSALERLGVDRWHTAGHRGEGVTVAILDTGWKGWKEQLGVTVPAKSKGRSFRLDGRLDAKDSQHGLLCSEIVHSIAPDAKLLFLNWEPDSPKHFLDAIEYARKEGAKVFTCSVIIPCWSDGEGGGPVHTALTKLIGEGKTAEDALFVACAGNVAQRHWSGPFRGDGDNKHIWPDGRTANVITPWGDELVSVELCCPATSSYSVLLTDAASGEEMGKAQTASDGACHSAVVRIAPRGKSRFHIQVKHHSGDRGKFHLVALGAWLEHYSISGSIPFPGDGPNVVAVGALETDGRRASYSSCGPNSTMPKPDYVALVPFPCRGRDRPFGGTSAAAPQAAGLAALLMSAHPDWSPKEVRECLERNAQDILPRGHDWETGYGQLKLPAPK